MVCIDTSRLRIGRPLHAEGLGRSGAGKLIGRFSGPREGVACAGRQSPGQGEEDISACGEKSSPSPWSSPRGEETTSELALVWLFNRQTPLCQRMRFVHSKLRGFVVQCGACGNGRNSERVQPSPSNCFSPPRRGDTARQSRNQKRRKRRWQVVKLEV
jgi:hypothetical protein